MNRYALISVVLLFLGMSLIHPCQEGYFLIGNSAIMAQDDSEGPTIEWTETNNSIVIAWDGIYTGQTEEAWKHEIWVNDTDGISVVIFRYRWYNEEEWINKTAILVEGNESRGLYQANFTYDVWWNYIEGCPETEGSGGNFFFKVWANDSLGHSSETTPISHSGGYDLVNPPIHFRLLSLPLLIPLLGVTAVVLALIIAVHRKRKSRP